MGILALRGLLQHPGIGIPALWSLLYHFGMGILAPLQCFGVPPGQSRPPLRTHPPFPAGPGRGGSRGCGDGKLGTPRASPGPPGGVTAFWGPRGRGSGAFPPLPPPPRGCLRFSGLVPGGGLGAGFWGDTALVTKVVQAGGGQGSPQTPRDPRLRGGEGGRPPGPPKISTSSLGELQ